MPWGSTKLVLGFVFSHGSGALKSFRLSLPQTLVMYLDDRRCLQGLRELSTLSKYIASALCHVSKCAKSC